MMLLAVLLLDLEAWLQLCLYTTDDGVYKLRDNRMMYVANKVMVLYLQAAAGELPPRYIGSKGPC